MQANVYTGQRLHITIQYPITLMFGIEVNSIFRLDEIKIGSMMSREIGAQTWLTRYLLQGGFYVRP